MQSSCASCAAIDLRATTAESPEQMQNLKLITLRQFQKVAAITWPTSRQHVASATKRRATENWRVLRQPRNNQPRKEWLGCGCTRWNLTTRSRIKGPLLVKMANSHLYSYSAGWTGAQPASCPSRKASSTTAENAAFSPPARQCVKPAIASHERKRMARLPQRPEPATAGGGMTCRARHGMAGLGTARRGKARQGLRCSGSPIQ